MKTLSHIIGERLKEVRQQLSMTQVEVIEALTKRGVEIGQGHISNIENGTRMPSVEVVVALAQIYDTSTDYVFGFTDNQQSASDIERELAGGGVGGKLGSLMASMTPERRQALISIAETFVLGDKASMQVILQTVQDVGGDEALNKVIDELESRFPGLTGGLLRGKGSPGISPKKIQ